MDVQIKTQKEIACMPEVNEASQTAVQSVEQKKIPLYKKWWCWLILVTVAACIAVAVIAGSSGRHKNNTGVADPASVIIVTTEAAAN